MKVLGIILAGGRGEYLGPLTQVRTSAALPVFGKYRSIDFTLSNMVNAGISKVGIITQYSPRSLMDHIGSGKEWDLDRKQGGLFILQPYYSPYNPSMGYKGTADAIFQNINILRRGNEDYVMIGSGDHIFKTDLGEVFRYHLETGSDITVLTSSNIDNYNFGNVSLLKCKEGRVIEWIEREGPVEDLGGSNCVALGVYFMNKFLLRELLYSTVPNGENELVKGVIIPNLTSLNVKEYRYNGYWRDIKQSKSCYYRTNLDILNPEIRRELFYEHGRVFTKLKDLPPPKITGTAFISNSVIADGCVVGGRLEDSVLFRDTRVLAGATVKGSVLLEGCIVEEGAYVENVILDKYCTVRSGKSFIGEQSDPTVIEKHGVI
ncbi:MAG TPA: glucose-1-phosphate adenylyltransferase subunit GlgD [Mesotoga infera]|nr:glucose-1-phosphate adenylyltransferase subunit GlgD [Mesotoga infera]HRR43258.1 glucose-1-phosphate adenylyltransferase subunit GlgD [Mesotoga sp.]HRV00743.1 glucose-1-phosphate adenylyltransferase subunit GlgD [Mesotoga sp.]